MNVVLYSNACSKCRVLKQKLDNKSIHYVENNSIDDMVALDILQVPVLSIDGKLLDFTKASEWIDQN